MRFSVVIVSWNGRDRIALPLEALRRADPAPAEVIVVDNGSRDGLARFIRKAYPEVRVVRARENLGFAGGNNLGIVNAGGEAVVLLNDDTEPEPGWLAPLAEAFEADKQLGIAGCRLVYPDRRTVQHLGGVVHANGLTDHLAWGEEATPDDPRAPVAIEAEYVTGAAMAIRRKVIATTGLLDAGFWPIYFEEVDFCERARRASWNIAVVPRSTVVHHESRTTGRLSPGFLRLYHRNRLRFLIKNRPLHQWPRILRAEARWLVRHRPWDNLWACALAYAAAPGQWMEIHFGGQGAGH